MCEIVKFNPICVRELPDDWQRVEVSLMCGGVRYGRILIIRRVHTSAYHSLVTYAADAYINHGEWKGWISSISRDTKAEMFYDTLKTLSDHVRYLGGRISRYSQSEFSQDWECLILSLHDYGYNLVVSVE